jgi:dienelactone hydrolase
MTRRRNALLALALLAAAVWFLAPYARGAALVIQAAGIEGWPRTVASWGSAAVRERDLTVATRHGGIRARVYVPAGSIDQTILLVPGVHARGIDEPRLVAFARHLAARGRAVATAELPDLTHYRITPRATHQIEDAAAWLAADRALAPDGRVGLAGISFSGGLMLVAAGRSALRGRVAFALSLGGHGDLPRTLRYLCTGRLPDGTTRPPHDYGVVIILLGVADRVAPPDQVAPLTEAIHMFLEASQLDMIDKPRAQQAFARAVEMEATLPEPARTLMHYVNTRDVARLGPVLLPHVAEIGGAPALSPERSAPPSAPVYLLHGTGDIVIPAMESSLLAAHLRDATEVHFLATPLITHADVDRPTDLLEIWRLIRFWTQVLGE